MVAEIPDNAKAAVLVCVSRLEWVVNRTTEQREALLEAKFRAARAALENALREEKGGV